jgi:hypothetical protein
VKGATRPAPQADVAPESRPVVNAAWVALVAMHKRRKASADYLAGARALYATLVGLAPGDVKSDMLRMYRSDTPIGRRLREDD